MKRKQWFSLHTWAGIQFSLLLCFILITGTLATISTDLDWLFNKSIRAESSVTPENVNWPELLTEAKKSCSMCTLLSIEIAHDDWITPQTLAVNEQGNRFRLFHNIHTSQVIGQGSWFNIQRFFRESHRNLMLPSIIGISIVSIMLIPLLVALISSMSVYKNWYKHFFKKPHFYLPKRDKQSIHDVQKRKYRKVWSELHKFVGLWSMWFIIIISLTGLWYFAELWGLRATYPAEAPPAETETVSPLPHLSAQRLDELLTIAHKVNPKLKIYKVLLPTVAMPNISKYRPYILFHGQEEAMLVRDRANHVALNIETGDVLSIRKATMLSLHARISEAADPLHFGTFLNSISRWIWFVFGLLLSGMTLSGIYLWVNRIMARTKLEQTGYSKPIWLGMAWMRWPSFIILLVYILLVLYEIFI